MAYSDNFFDIAARRIIAGTGDTARTPRPQQISWHLGELADVDPSTGTAHFSVNGSSLVIPNVRVLQTYGPGYQPVTGHKVWAQQNGTDLLIMGQHLVPIGTVSFP
jgi:hypothetical protein